MLESCPTDPLEDVVLVARSVDEDVRIHRALGAVAELLTLLVARDADAGAMTAAFRKFRDD
ncbi:MAG: hypothetical protein IPN03_05885 [Holophagales bacterium]|nr:hypothetical protein [Holophagales bacterium]